MSRAIIKLLESVEALGVTLTPAGDGIVVFPCELLRPEIIEALTENKPAILGILTHRTLHIAFQVNYGEFDGCPSDVRRQLVKALKTVDKPVCKQALRRLGATKEAA
jgi:hypothetical protein